MKIRRKRPMYSRKRSLMMKRWRMRRKYKSNKRLRPSLKLSQRKRAIILME
jgi:hypothetical protein